MFKSHIVIHPGIRCHLLMMQSCITSILKRSGGSVKHEKIESAPILFDIQIKQKQQKDKEVSSKGSVFDKQEWQGVHHTFLNVPLVSASAIHNIIKRFRDPGEMFACKERGQKPTLSP